MKLRKGTFALALSCSIGLMSLSVHAEDDEVSLEDRINKFIIDKAKSALLGQAESFIIDAIFGSSSSVSVAKLHQDSLDEIERLIISQSDRDRILEIRGSLNSLMDLINEANSTFQHSGYDSNKMWTIVERAYELINHEGYSSNDEYFKLTKSKALAYSLFLSAQVERVLQDEISQNQLSANASDWAADLAQMGSATDGFIQASVSITYPHSMCGGSEPYGNSRESMSAGIDRNSAPELEQNAMVCEYLVTDNIGGQQFSYDPLRDPTFASSRAHDKLSQLRETYRIKFKGVDFHLVVNELENI